MILLDEMSVPCIGLAEDRRLGQWLLTSPPKDGGYLRQEMKGPSHNRAGIRSPAGICWWEADMLPTGHLWYCVLVLFFNSVKIQNSQLCCMHFPSLYIIVTLHLPQKPVRDSSHILAQKSRESPGQRRKLTPLISTTIFGSISAEKNSIERLAS